MPHSVVHDAGPEGHVVAISGDADVTAAADLEGCMVEAVTAGARRVTIDLSEATLIDSRTIAALVRWDGKLSSVGGALPIACPNPNILRMLATIGLDQSLSIFASRGEAAANCRGASAFKPVSS
jgi:anti-anti-sigma factor